MFALPCLLRFSLLYIESLFKSIFYLVYYYSICFQNIYLSFKRQIKVCLLLSTRLPSSANPSTISGGVSVEGLVWGGTLYVNEDSKCWVKTEKK